MKNIQVGFIGCGKIASFHADVLVHLGVSIVALTARASTEKALEFKSKYAVRNFYTSWETMVAQENLDALWVIPSWDAIDAMLIPLLGSGLPLFIEKPIALSSEKIAEAIFRFGPLQDLVQIGYNRRFYDFIPILKENIKSKKLNAIEVHIPENSAGIKDDRLRNLLFIQNSSHMMDLLLHILDLPSLHVHKVFKGLYGES
jgi:myo-inositol 2-dehydrogenase/D-chiro-inositol 1-dehydrogenase